MDLERRVGQNWLVSQAVLSGILEEMGLTFDQLVGDINAGGASFADLIKARLDAIPTPISDLDQLIREMIVRRQVGR